MSLRMSARVSTHMSTHMSMRMSPKLRQQPSVFLDFEVELGREVVYHHIADSKKTEHEDSEHETAHTLV